MPVKPIVTIADVIDVLNVIAAHDQDVARFLIDDLVPCSPGLVECGELQLVEEDGIPKVGLLGIINSFFGRDENGWGPIGGLYDDDGSVRFTRSPAKL